VSLDSGDAARHVTIGAGLFSIFLLVGLGIYPVVRKITGRLEDLQRSVDELGGGKLSARVDIEGADEVGVLARSFNRTASQLETLVKAQKSLLANASHELRSPLARIQMALGLLGTDGANSAVEEINRSVHELDQLVGEILLTSRLESGEIIPSLQLESIDLATFLRDACAPYGAKVECAGLNVTGDRILLKRLLRNLLENAQRHGAGTPIEVSANKVGEGWVEISVGDRGPGVPVSERERIFDPFYRAAGAREGDGGMGVGLALVRSIAQLHRGTVYCGDRVGGGSIFVVRFPPI
jgi:signal transduction histidine kinase